MASASKLEKVNRLLKSVLTSEKGGVAINRLQGDYHELTGDSLPFREFGYPSLEAYLRSIPHVVSLQRGPDGATMCKAVTDETIEHITSLVSRQKSKKKVGGARTKLSRYGRPNFRRAVQPQSRPQRSFYKPLHTTYAKPVTSSPSVKKYPKWPLKSPPKSPLKLPLKSTSKQTANIGKFSVQTRESSKTSAQSTTSVKSVAPTTSSKELPAPTVRSAKSSAPQTSAPKSSSTSTLNPGPWSGKLGSKRSQSVGSTRDEKQYERSVSLTTELSSASTKPDEHLYITVNNDAFQLEQFSHQQKGKTKGAANIKQEWSANFEVPPRFKKLMSAPGTDSQGVNENNNVAPKTDHSSVGFKTRKPEVDSGPPSPQLNSATTDWVQKILQEKANGIWASALRDMHMKELGSPLEPSVIDQMAKLSLITKESIYNNDIIYPKMTVTVKDLPKMTKRTVTVGDEQQTGVTGDETGDRSLVEAKTIPTQKLSKNTDSVHSSDQDNFEANQSMTDILKRICKKHSLSLCHTVVTMKVAGQLYISVRCSAGSLEGTGGGRTENMALEAASANIFHQWNIAPKDVVAGCQEELYLKIEHGAGLCSCSVGESKQDSDVPACLSSWLKKRSWKPSDDWSGQESKKSTVTQESSITEKDKLNARAVRFGLKSKAVPKDVSRKELPEVFSAVKGTKFCVVNSIEEPQPAALDKERNISFDSAREMGDVSKDNMMSSQVEGSFGGQIDLKSKSELSQDEILRLRAERFGLPLNQYSNPRDEKMSKPSKFGEKSDRVDQIETTQISVEEPSQRPSDQDIRQVLKETFGKMKIYETVKRSGSGNASIVTICFIAGPFVGVGDGSTKSKARVTALKDLLENHKLSRNKAAPQYKFKPINSAPTTYANATPAESAPQANANAPLASNPSDAQLPSNNSTPSPVSNEGTVTPSEAWGSPIIEAPGVPSLVLPEEDDLDVYVAYIKSLADFYIILIGDDYSEQLIALEEDMRTFYQCCTWTLTEPPEEGDCNVAELNREWLRVEVRSVQGDKVECFLLDHGDIEIADVDSLKPLAENFLQVPFQVVRCKLAGSEQVALDDTQALQMFCQLALGKNLLAEVVSREGDRIEMELFDASDVSILEQCMAAGI